MIEENLNVVRKNIADSAKKAGKRPEDIAIICVTKKASIEQVKEAIACGITDIGENRIQNAVEKYNLLRSAALKWHLIGHLQTNKVKKAVEVFDLIHSVDSLHIAEAISKEAAKINKTQDVLIQVNVSGEQSKFGIKPESAIDLIKQIVLLSNIRVLGLMTIGPLDSSPDDTRQCFRSLKKLFDNLNSLLVTHDSQLTTLSMGMSGDYQMAIEEGSTMVRIGSAIFK